MGLVRGRTTLVQSHSFVRKEFIATQGGFHSPVVCKALSLWRKLLVWQALWWTCSTESLDFNSNHASVSIFECDFPLKHKPTLRLHCYSIPVHVDIEAGSFRGSLWFLHAFWWELTLIWKGISPRSMNLSCFGGIWTNSFIYYYPFLNVGEFYGLPELFIKFIPVALNIINMLRNSTPDLSPELYLYLNVP